jgi:acyl-CoA-binding protein
LQFYQDTLESNDDEKEGDFEIKENDKNADRDAAGLKGKSEEEDEEDQKCKF